MKSILIVFITFTIINSTPLTCTEALTMTECKDIINGIYECIWYENTCQLKTCQNSQIPCDGQVYNGELCTTNKQGCQSVKNCSDIDNQQSCSLLKPYGIECYWQDSCIVKNCSHNSKSNCKLTNGEQCIYQNENCSSINKCTDIIDKSSCLASQILKLNCIWIDDQCLTDSCKAIQSKENCFKSIRNSEKCFFTQNRDEDNYCLSCSQLNEQCKCNQYSIFGCQWQNNSCQELQLKLSCNAYQNEIQCVDDKLCVWYKPMNKCLTIQEASENDRACDIYIFGSILHIWTIIILIIFW
ncbi:unnamed protein product [Paramecium primaurelia]|uniref:Transmembrane protein n=1 Tax=Paramecium primaurelia TaxID=5886 RepID=A0A8S1N1G3_PARPR|nr:unnamed protein product [Paramecium primaurelia]